MLNISRIGLVTGAELDPPIGELEDLRHLNVPAAIQCIEENRDRILGIKIRLSDNLAAGGKNENSALLLAREAADATGLPLMIHTPRSTLGLPRILAEMRRGDILTHCFHAHSSGILDSDMKVRPEVRAAIERGIHLDVDLSAALSRITSIPAATIKMQDQLGTLKVGATADAVVLRLCEGQRPLEDSIGQVETVEHWLEPIYVIKGGRVVARHL